MQQVQAGPDSTKIDMPAFPANVESVTRPSSVLHGYIKFGELADATNGIDPSLSLGELRLDSDLNTFKWAYYIFDGFAQDSPLATIVANLDVDVTGPAYFLLANYASGKWDVLPVDLHTGESEYTVLQGNAPQYVRADGSICVGLLVTKGGSVAVDNFIVRVDSLPEVPLNLEAGDEKSPYEIAITWDVAKDAISYDLYCRRKGEAEFQFLEHIQSLISTEHAGFFHNADNPVLPCEYGVVYEYQVWARNGEQVSAVGSNIDSGFRGLMKPAGLVASQGEHAGYVYLYAYYGLLGQQIQLYRDGALIQSFDNEQGFFSYEDYLGDTDNHTYYITVSNGAFVSEPSESVLGFCAPAP
jgi:hypothetical protein